VATVRRPDWQERLAQVIREHADREFAWARADCCLFIARSIDAMTDSDLETRLSVLYQDEVGGLRLIADHGSLEGAVSQFLGESVEEFANRGDAVLIDGGEGDAVGICIGLHVVAMGPQGLQKLPRTVIRKAWRT
jgi:hypothetical protein